MSMTARQKGLLDLYYRILNGDVSASDIVGTVDPINLPPEATADIGTARILDGAVTMAKLGSDVTMIKNIQRGSEAVAAGATTTQAITSVDLSKSMLLLNIIPQSGSSTMVGVSVVFTSDVLLTFVSGSASFDAVVEWQVIEFI